MELGIYPTLPKKLHLEPTTRCNARCPQCSRTYLGSLITDPRLEMVDWNPIDLEKTLADPFFKELEGVIVNGNFGDIVMHPNPKELITVLLNRGLKEIVIHTNGGGLNTEFWSWLGSKPNVMVQFGIDGLKDTHHLYRRNTVFEVVMKNAKAFIDAGGIALWAMTVFKHNEHQVEECRKLATEYNFKYFRERPSTRWDIAKDYIVLDNDMKESYRLEPASYIANRFKNFPKDVQLKSKIKIPEVSEFDLNKLKPAQPSLNICAIECLVAEESFVFLSAKGNLYPCCWVGSDHENSLMKNTDSSFVQTFYKDLGYDLDFNNVLKNKISDIIKSGLFTKIEDSWMTRNQFDICQRTCRTRSNMKHQYKNSKIYIMKEEKSE